MRTKLTPQKGSTLTRPFGLPVREGAVLLLAAACAMASTVLLPAQAPAANTALIQKPVHPRKHAAAHPAAAQEPATPPPAISQPIPEKPNWPAFAQPAAASVVWNSEGLTIDAANSSLEQILKDVSTATGIKVDGFASDQRIFGAYGPGKAGDVLSQLLQGSGYNVLMIGDLAPGTPRHVILSARQAGLAQPQPRGNQPPNLDENEGEEQPQIVQPEPEPPPQQIQPMPQRPMGMPGSAPRSPQQIMEEMQQRQQQIQQQQQQQPNNWQN